MDILLTTFLGLLDNMNVVITYYDAVILEGESLPICEGIERGNSNDWLDPDTNIDLASLCVSIVTLKGDALWIETF